MGEMQQVGSIKTTIASFVVAAFALVRVALGQDVLPATMDAREEYAFSVGMQAYIYGYPLVIAEISRRQMLADPAIRVNRFHHYSDLMTPTVKTPVSANVDTMMSIAWVDFSSGPQMLHVPAMHGRYFDVQFNDFYSNSFTYVGLRATAADEQRYFVVGPHWHGSAPAGLKVIRCPTNIVFVVARLLVDGEKDVANVRALQQELTLTPFDSSQPPPQPASGVEDGTLPPPAIVARMDTESYFAMLTRLLQLYPPPPRDWAMVRQFKHVGIDIDSGFDPSRLDEAKDRGLVRARAASILYLSAVGPELGGRTVNGWWTPAGAGDFGTDYVLRADMARNFIWPNVPEEAVYPMTSVDGAGRELDGEHRTYVLHFANGETPPVDTFWSVTMFNSKRALVENPIHRYSIGSLTHDLEFNSDGSLDLFIQSDTPPGHVRNWLPAPAGPFSLTMRLYLPKPQILNGACNVPPVQCTTR
jgi:hypothetical protein